MRIANEILMHFRSLKKSAGDLSLSESIDTDKDGNSLSLIDVISVDDNMLENLSTKEMNSQLRKYIDDLLTEREAQIIRLRYGLDNKLPKTQREVAAICNISRSYVSRIEKKALGKLQAAMERDG